MVPTQAALYAAVSIGNHSVNHPLDAGLVMLRRSRGRRIIQRLGLSRSINVDAEDRLDFSMRITEVGCVAAQQFSIVGLALVHAQGVNLVFRFAEHVEAEISEW